MGCGFVSDSAAPVVLASVIDGKLHFAWMGRGNRNGADVRSKRFCGRLRDLAFFLQETVKGLLKANEAVRDISRLAR